MTQILELTDKGFKAAIINICSRISKMVIMNEQMGNLIEK